MAAPRLLFHEQLRQLREDADQSTEVMAILLNLEEADYLEIEAGRALPDNETLKRLCTVAEWNYHDVQRMIINDRANPAPAAPGAAGFPKTPQGAAPPRPGEVGSPANQVAQALQGFPLEKPIGLTQRPDTLGNRLKDVRTHTGQSVDIISRLLNIDDGDYRRLEAGEAPGDNLLRRISLVYDWNYHDLLNLLRTEQARALQPRRMGSPFPGNTVKTGHLKSVLNDLDRLFQGIPEKEQDFVLSQLELVRNTMQNMQRAS